MKNVIFFSNPKKFTCISNEEKMGKCKNVKKKIPSTNEFPLHTVEAIGKFG